MKPKILWTVLACTIILILLPLTASAESGEFVIKNDILIQYNGTGNVAVIPDGVTEIGSFAFRNCFRLTSVTIPESVTRIEHGASRNRRRTH